MAEYIKKSDVKKAFLHGFIDRKKYPEFVKWIAESAERIVNDMPSADVQPVNQWISVKNRLPNEDDCYLVVIESEICVSIDIAEYSENRWHKHDKVLYWQPLPEPPKDGDTNGRQGTKVH